MKLVYEDGEQFEIDRITNKSPEEMLDILNELSILDDAEWEGDVEEFLHDKGVEFIPLILSKDSLTPQFYDFELNLENNEVTRVEELSVMKQAEYMINRMEYGNMAFTGDERNLIMNYAYKLDNMKRLRKQFVRILMVCT